MTIREIRKMSSCTQSEFARKYHIPLQTLKQWESSPDRSSYRQCPEYVRLLLQEAVVREIIDQMAAALEKSRKRRSAGDLAQAAESIWG